jgi:hypothetical protein
VDIETAYMAKLDGSMAVDEINMPVEKKEAKKK